jgi:hypothetical protein
MVVIAIFITLLLVSLKWANKLVQVPPAAIRSTGTNYYLSAAGNIILSDVIIIIYKTYVREIYLCSKICLCAIIWCDILGRIK